jgi:hypothetical protein
VSLLWHPPRALQFAGVARVACLEVDATFWLWLCESVRLRNG